MFLFPSKKREREILSKDTLVLDFLMRIEKEFNSFSSLYIHTNKLQNFSLRNVQRLNMVDTFESVVVRKGGKVFNLVNDNVLVVFNKESREDVLTSLVKIRFMFSDDPFLRDAVDLEEVGFVEFIPLHDNAMKLKNIIRKSMRSAPKIAAEEEESKKDLSFEDAGYGYAPITIKGKIVKRELTPHMLARVQKALAMTDFSSLIRRQSVCAVIGRAPPQMIFDEIFVSIANLRDMLLPDVDLTANPWLFQHLTETLDKRVMASVAQRDDGSFNSNFSMNLNVSTILSDDFLAFDDNVNPSMKPSIILEMQLVDIFSDIKAFILAKTFAQYRGYRICIDGITVDKLKYINREYLSSDLIKIIWHPSFMDVIQEDKKFIDYINRAERARMILCRVDDPAAVEVGNAFGINLYQGRYIQRLLAAQPRRTNFVLKRR
jgi:hypothetical protein